MRYPAPPFADSVTYLNWTINRAREGNLKRSMDFMTKFIYNLYDDFSHDTANSERYGSLEASKSPVAGDADW